MPTKIGAAVVGVVAAAVVAAVMTIAVENRPVIDSAPLAGAGVSATTPAPSSLPTAPSVLGRVAASKVLNDTAADKTEITRYTRMAAKLTTWATASSVFPTAGQSRSTISASGQVWIVAVSGTIVPTFVLSSDHTCTWAVYFYEAQNGSLLGTECGSGGAWPPGFDSLKDLSTTG